MKYYYLDKRSKNLYLDLMILINDKTIYFKIQIDEYKVTETCQNKRNIYIKHNYITQFINFC